MTDLVLQMADAFWCTGAGKTAKLLLRQCGLEYTQIDNAGTAV